MLGESPPNLQYICLPFASGLEPPLTYCNSRFLKFQGLNQTLAVYFWSWAYQEQAHDLFLCSQIKVERTESNLGGMSQTAQANPTVSRDVILYDTLHVLYESRAWPHLIIEQTKLLWLTKHMLNGYISSVPYLNQPLRIIFTRLIWQGLLGKHRWRHFRVYK